MTANLLESAIKRNQVSMFFRGEGEYFSLNRSTGEHAYLLSLTNNLGPLMSNSPNGLGLAKTALTTYLRETNPSDIEHVKLVLRNSYCFGLAENRGALTKTDILKGESDIVFEELSELIKRALSQLPESSNIVGVLREYSVFFQEVNLSFLAYFIQQLVENSNEQNL